MFISNIVTQREVSTWQQKSNILIHGKTGTGKTMWILNVLGEKLKREGKKALIFENRSSTRRQLQLQIQNKQLQNTLEVWNYQKIEQSIKMGKYINLKQYEYIVLDEWHYFLVDSDFNHFTDLSLSYLLDITAHATRVFMSATGDDISCYLQDDANITFDNVYTMNDNYNPILEVNTYVSSTTRDDVVDTIVGLCKHFNHKALIFLNDTRAMMEYVQHYRSQGIDVGYVVARGNDLYNNEVHQVLTEIETTQQFSCQILFATSVLSTGVSLVDSKLKHIMVDSFDIDNIKQSIGRKRLRYLSNVQQFDMTDRVHVYVRYYARASLSQAIRRAKEKVYVCNCFHNLDSSDFQRRLVKNSFRKEDGKTMPISSSLFYTQYTKYGFRELRINTMEEYRAYVELEKLQERAKMGENDFLQKHLSFTGDINFIEPLDVSNDRKREEQETLDQLYSLVGKKLYTPIQKQILIDIINVKRGGRQLRSLQSLNSALDECGYPFTIKKEPRETKTINGKVRNFTSIWCLYHIN